MMGDHDEENMANFSSAEDPSSEEHLFATLDDLPSALVVTNVPTSVFVSPDVKEEFEQLFRHYDPEHIEFDYFKSFRRVRVRFSSPEAAILARLHSHQLELDNCVLRCFFAQTNEMLEPIINTTAEHLTLPELEKQWLISPPASPPVGWEPAREMAPCINFELISRLASLANEETTHEIQPATDKLPGIVVHGCEEMNDGPVMKPKICHTPRPGHTPPSIFDEEER